MAKEVKKVVSAKETYEISQNKTPGTKTYNMWSVRKQGSEKVLKHLATKNEAIDHATSLLSKSGGAIAIYGANGKIQQTKEVKPTVKEEAPKAVAKPAKEAPKKEGLERYIIAKVLDKKDPNFGKWRLRKHGSDKTIKYFKTQKEAIEYQQSINKDNKQVTVHRKTGGVRTKIKD